MSKVAEIYRIVNNKGICPHGLKALHLLKRKKYQVTDHHLRTREEIDAIKTQYQVTTTPQIIIDGNRIGGYSELKKYFNCQPKELSYTPIIAIFATTFLMSLVLTLAIAGTLLTIKLLELFIALSMCVLAIQKLKDLEAFSLQFITYDLLAQKWVNYAYIYPFIEMLGGIAMIGSILIPVVAPIVFIASTIGAFSVYKAVYIEQRSLKCACIGGNSNVPLGFVSLTENLMMMVLSAWMFLVY